MVRWISLALYLAFYVITSVISQRNYTKTVEAVLSGRISRRKIYWGQIAGMGLPSVLLLCQTAAGIFQIRELGLSLPAFGLGLWFVITATVLYIIYLVYLLYTLVSLRKNTAACRFRQDIPDRMRALFPSSKKDKRLWLATAVVTGITEELLFRGLFIGAAAVMLPSVPVWIVLLLSSLLFGAGHLYQGARQAVLPALLGLLYGVFFLAFGSVLPVMLVHALQDLRAVWALPETPEPPPYAPEQPCDSLPDPAEAARQADREEREGLMASLGERIKTMKP